MASPSQLYVTDQALAQRLERAEGSANAAFVEARARCRPASGATWLDVAGTYAMFDGVGSPITQTFGLGLFAPAAAADLETIEAFFHDRGADVFHEVSPLTDPALLGLLSERGYRPVELTSVMHQPIVDQEEPPASPIHIRRVEPGEAALWTQTSARGWSEPPELAALVLELGQITAQAQGTTCFLAEADGESIGTAALATHGGVALLAGASTVPEHRGRGAQAALLRARLRYAKELGCDLAMMGAWPGSGSQRNAERQGFRIAYTRIKWHQPTAV